MILKLGILVCTALLLGCSGKNPEDDLYIEGSSGPAPSPGAVVSFDWKDLVAGFSESEEHLYGFDKDPKGLKNPDYFENVYMSVRNGELAKVKLDLPEKTYTSYSLLDTNTGNWFGPWNAGGELEIDLAPGMYSLYGDGKKLGRYISVIGLDPRIVNVDYVQFDSENLPCTAEGCYSFERTSVNFDRVFSQALTYGNLSERLPEYFGMKNVFSVDLTEKIEGNKILDSLMRNHVNRKYGDAESRVVLAINSIQWYWILKNVETLDLIVLNNYVHTKQFNNYEPVPVTISSCSDESDTTSTSLKAQSFDWNKQTATVLIEGIENYAPCAKVSMVSQDPMLPVRIETFANGTYSTAAQINWSRITLYGKQFLIVAPHLTGESSQYTILHELGHSLGLLDIYKDVNDGTYKRFYDEDRKFIQENATSEANLMTYAIPIGPKLRYRNSRPVYTGTNVLREGLLENQWKCVNQDSCNWNAYFGGNE